MFLYDRRARLFQVESLLVRSCEAIATMVVNPLSVLGALKVLIASSFFPLLLSKTLEMSWRFFVKERQSSISSRAVREACLQRSQGVFCYFFLSISRSKRLRQWVSTAEVASVE